MSNPQTRTTKRQSQDEMIAKMVQPVLNIPIYELLNPEGIELIHQKSMQVLSEVGIDFYLAEARQILEDHTVDVQGETAYFDPGLVDEYISKAPSHFTQLARNPSNNLIIGKDHMVFAPVYGAPFVHDLKNGRREATLEDFQNFVKLAYLSPYIHHSGGTVVEPMDIPIDTRHLDMLYSHIKFNDKAFMGSVTSKENAEDSVRMAEILFGAETIRENPAVISTINTHSPRCMDARMLEALSVYARAQQAVIITPFILSGAMAPVSLAGTLIQQNAEALAGLVYTQMVEPGTPVVYGSFMTNIDLKSGIPVFGSPESQTALLASAQMARRYKLPFRSGGMFTSAKIPDAQSAYESMMTMLPTIQAGTNFILHAAGWLENGMTTSYEKFVMDCELLGMFHKLVKGIDFSDEALAMDSLLTVPAGDHHLGTDHTMNNYKTAFYRSTLFDYREFDQWISNGHKPVDQVATKKVAELLSAYEEPELDPNVEDALRDFVTQRKSEINSKS